MRSTPRSRSPSPLPASKRVRRVSGSIVTVVRSLSFPSPSPPPSGLQSCDVAQFDQQDYARLFVQELDTSPTTFWSVAQGSERFAPRLCLAPAASCSPLSAQQHEPVCIASLPFPASWRSVIAGVWSERSVVLSTAAAVHYSRVPPHPQLARQLVESGCGEQLAAGGRDDGVRVLPPSL
jgi:hypothetical protein